MEDQVQQEPVVIRSLDPSSGLSPLQQEALVYVIVALVLTCFFVFVNNAPAIRNAGFFSKLLGIITGTGLGAVGP